MAGRNLASPHLQLAIGPDGQLVAAGIGEVEPAAAGKAECRGDDGAAGLADPGLRVGEVEREQHHQRARTLARYGARAPAGVEAAVQPAVLEGGVVRPVVGELPAKRLLVESL